MQARGGLSWTVAVIEDLPAASYPEARSLGEKFRALRSSPSGTIRAVVELHRNCGGLAPRIVLGGVLATRPGLHLALDVRESEEGWAGTPFEGRSGVRYQPGLPPEFSDPVRDGCRTELLAGSPVSGAFVVDRAGHMIETSPLLARDAAVALVYVLAAVQRGEDGLPAAETYLRGRFSR